MKDTTWLWVWLGLVSIGFVMLLWLLRMMALIIQRLPF